MTNIDCETIRNCYRILEVYKDKKEVSNLMYILENILTECDKNGILEVPINNNLLLNLFLVFSDELYNEKMEYIDYKIENRRFSFLDKNISSGTACRIQSHGSLKNDGYAREFLYLTPYSAIKNHKHNDSIEIYNTLTGVIKVNGIYTDTTLIGVGEEHYINEINNLSIVETYKISTDKLTEENICNMNDDINKTLVLSLKKN